MPEQQVAPSDEISLKELILKAGEWLRYLKTQWLKIVIAGIIGSIIGFAYAWIQPTIYTAKMTFVLEEGKSGGGLASLGGLASIAGQFGVDVGSGGGGGLLSGDNILLYFKSESLAREALLSANDSSSKKSIADLYAEVYGLKAKWSKSEKIGNIDFQPASSKVKYTRLQDSLLQSIVKGILESRFTVAKTDKKAGFIEVSASMKDECLSKEYCERIVKIAIDKYINIKTERQKSTVDKLQERVDSIAALLRQKTASGASLQTSSNTMDINPLYKTGTAVAVETTTRDKTMLSTIFATVVQNLELAKFSLSQETPVIQVVDAPLLPLKKNELSKLKTALIGALVLSFLFSLYITLYRIFKAL
jgi:uncharacterized protein involved in exopolysaccharide biosynthesis